MPVGPGSIVTLVPLQQLTQQTRHQLMTHHFCWWSVLSLSWLRLFVTVDVDECETAFKLEENKRSCLSLDYSYFHDSGGFRFDAWKFFLLKHNSRQVPPKSACRLWDSWSSADLGKLENLSFLTICKDFRQLLFVVNNYIYRLQHCCFS